MAKELNMKVDEVHVAYVRYFATGEGVRIFVAVGKGYVTTERLFKVNVPEYFHGGMVVKPLDSEDAKMAQVTDLLPRAVVKLFTESPPRTTEYFSTLHYNLS
ncbi:MAG TPA: hypothetical protein PLF92_12470 [Arenimonas sp.]|nr:hypothetical protein [Arenimonas sp.]